MRKLASIQTIVDLQPIPNKDLIEYATVQGWHVIVRKGEFSVGDKCVYFEVDSIVPETEAFEFLRPRNFKIKTLKMASVVSQGLALPLSVFPQITKTAVGTDVTELLNIKRYDPEAEKEAVLLAQKEAMEKNKLKRFLMKHKWYRRLFSKKSGGGFPSWIRKSDETRIQSMPFLFNQAEKKILLVSEKVDGTSTTAFYIAKRGLFSKAVFGVCSRNVYLKTQDNSIYWKMSIKHNFENVLKQLAKIHKARTVVLQGESICPGIQGDKYQLGERFYAFNLIIDGKPLHTLQMADTLGPYGIETVPVLDTRFTLPDTCDEMVAYSTAKSVLNKNILREGVVCRTYDGSISFKAVSPEFLLKNKE